MSVEQALDLGSHFPAVGDAANLHISPSQPQGHSQGVGSIGQHWTVTPHTQSQVEIAKELDRITMFVASTSIA